MTHHRTDQSSERRLTTTSWITAVTPEKNRNVGHTSRARLLLQADGHKLPRTCPRLLKLRVYRHVHNLSSLHRQKHLAYSKRDRRAQSARATIYPFTIYRLPLTTATGSRKYRMPGKRGGTRTDEARRDKTRARKNYSLYSSFLATATYLSGGARLRIYIILG